MSLKRDLEGMNQAPRSKRRKARRRIDNDSDSDSALSQIEELPFRDYEGLSPSPTISSDYAGYRLASPPRMNAVSSKLPLKSSMKTTSGCDKDSERGPAKKKKRKSVRIRETENTVIPYDETAGYDNGNGQNADLFSDKTVLFIFEKESTGGKQVLLWARRDQLQDASPYWKTLFDSGYLEGEEKLEGLSKWKETLANDVRGILDRCHGHGAASLATFDDSDAEEMSAPQLGLSKGKGKQVIQGSSISEDSPAIRYIIVNDASSKTYRALLHWIETGRISLSTLTSLVPSQIAKQTSASPKSVYALAHKLGITELQTVALEHFSNQLYSHNVLKELFSTHAALYPEIAEVAMNAAVEHMPAIKSSGGHSYINEVLGAAHLDQEYVAKTVTELFGRT